VSVKDNQVFWRIIAMTNEEIVALCAAKKNIQKYQYGSVRHKSACAAYISKRTRMAKKYNCTAHDIEREMKSI
jgi:hypothetical protein